MAYTEDSKVSCACKCEAYLYCTAWSWYPQSLSDAIPVNCFLFNMAPANITLCESSSGATTGLVML